MPSKKKAPKKPVKKHQSEPAYDWHDVSEWIRHVTGKDMRDWEGKFNRPAGASYDDTIPYRDMWHWICDNQDVHNGSYFYLTLDDEMIDDDDREHLFIREIFAVLRQEFPEAEGEMYCWTSW